MFLLDTDIIIYSLKNDKKVIDNFHRYRHDPKVISVVTYGELIYGAEKSERRTENLAKIHRMAEIFPVIDISKPIMDTFGAVKADLERKGNMVDDFDLMIASTAMTMGYCIVTNNLKHYCLIPGIDCVNWLK